MRCDDADEVLDEGGDELKDMMRVFKFNDVFIRFFLPCFYTNF
jgi:hypothetical protein